MLPTVQIFGRTIAMYGFMIASGYIIGVAVAAIRSRKYQIPVEDVIFISFFAGIGLFVGAKLLYLITVIPQIISHYELVASNPSSFFISLVNGYVFYGGFIGAILGMKLYCRLYQLTFMKVLDLYTPSIPLIHAFGRVGCFFAGCCYGIPYEGVGKVVFRHSLSAPNHISLFPTQLLESAINFIVAIFLLAYAKPDRKPGRVLGIYLLSYAVLRFIMEYFRGDIIRGGFFGLSTSQWISILLLPIGIGLVLGQQYKLFSSKKS